MSKSVIAVSGWGFYPVELEKFRKGISVTGKTFAADSFFHGQQAPWQSLSNELREPCHVIAWSLGSMLALEALINGALNISSLCLFGAAASFVRDSENPKAMPRKIVQGMKKRMQTEPELVLSEFSKRIAETGGAAVYRRAELDSRVSALISGLDFLERFDIRSQIAKVGVPTLIIHGDSDPIVPMSASLELSAGISNSKHHVLENCGHQPFCSHAEICRNLAIDFISTITSS